MGFVFFAGCIALLILLKAGVFDSHFANKRKSRKPKLKIISSNTNLKKHQPEFEHLWKKPKTINTGTDEVIYTQHKEEPPTKNKMDAYYLNKRLFTPYELKYLKALQDAVGHQYWVMGKVRIADIFGVRKTRRPREYYYSFNRIKAKHFDYILCNKDTYRPIAAIELDDSSHLRSDRIERDNFVNDLCKSNNFLLIRVKPQQNYIADEIRLSISRHINEFYDKKDVYYPKQEE